MEERVIFTEEMKKEYTILIPQMAPFHFDLLSSTLNSFGYKSKVLKNQGANLAYEGNKYVHNDTCVPAIYVIGQFLDAIKSGEYDVNKIALIITQTGGGCRASNYIHLLRSALKKAGYGFIPVISLNASNIESNPGFNLSIPLLKKLVQSITIGDLIMQLHNETKPYEVNENETDELSEKWLRYLEKEYENKTIISNHKMYSYLKEMVADYEKIPTKDIKKPKVGIVGEIYVKYSPVGNNNLEKFLIDEGCEVVTPGIMDFLLYTFESTCYDIKQYGGSKLKSIIFKILAKYMEKPRAKVNSILKNTKYRQMISFKELRQLALPFIGYGTHVGEGWLLTAEIIELINSDVTNVITTQPFGCLPNHIVARGMFKSIKEAFPYANLTSIDFDTSSSAINQQNRIKLLVMNAKEKLDD
ncbi:putative nucleotide-binding protein (sugar kinase/HSP70/actin superfamily) [Bacilli bacterium PM5-9]|nr:putative nucleotide-binding protein (sugar kinase/HSP70/actin superfamily) [Bacilli bacterium PM5-9]